MSSTLSLRAVALLLALACWTGAPNPAFADVAVTYQPASGKLSLPVNAGVPAITELRAPARLVIDLPGSVDVKAHEFASGRVSRLAVEQLPGGTRVTLFLREALGGHWSVDFVNDSLVLTLPPGGAHLVSQPASPKPRPARTPWARPLTPPPPPRLPAPHLVELPRPVTSPTAHPRPTATPTPPSAAPSARPATPHPASPRSASPRPASPRLVAPKVSSRPAPLTGEMSRLTSLAYDDEVRFLVLALTRRVTPKSSLTGRQLVIDLPGTVVRAPITRAYPGALVREVHAFQPSPSWTRVSISLSRAIGQNWGIKQTGNNLVLVFDHLAANAPDAPEGPRATEAPTAPPRPSPFPSVSVASPAVLATPKPTPKPTPRPTPMSTPRPTPRPTPTAKPAAGHAFVGTVYHINTGEPLAGVRVTIAGHLATSDGSGRFAFASLPAGRLQVTVNAAGFASQVFDIVVPEDKSLSLNMVPSIH